MSNKELLISAIVAFIAVATAGFFSNVILQSTDSTLIIASSGALAMLVFGLPHALVSRTWNLIGGHSVFAVVGVVCFYLIAIPLAAIYFLKCMHSLSGATVVTAIIGDEAIHQLGYVFIIMPIFLIL